MEPNTQQPQQRDRSKARDRQEAQTPTKSPGQPGRSETNPVSSNPPSNEEVCVPCKMAEEGKIKIKPKADLGRSESKRPESRNRGVARGSSKPMSPTSRKGANPATEMISEGGGSMPQEEDDS